MPVMQPQTLVSFALLCDAAFDKLYIFDGTGRLFVNMY